LKVIAHGLQDMRLQFDAKITAILHSRDVRQPFRVAGGTMAMFRDRENIMQG
jgi:hypothetical protein